MSRRSRKQLVGKIENYEAVKRLRELGILERLVHREWWSQRLGQIDASQVLRRSAAQAETNSALPSS
jgi:hypothetical protein